MFLIPESLGRYLFGRLPGIGAKTLLNKKQVKT